MAKWVYSFGDGKAEGGADMRNLLGGKGANLAEMSSLGLPVPPGFTITTEVCTWYYANGKACFDNLLFGSYTVLGDGTTARNGFEALAVLDANGDGRIDARDPELAALLVWFDRDRDGRSSPDELVPASDIVVSISLEQRSEARCDARLNCERERSAMTWRDGDGNVHRGSVVDVYLARR